MRGACINARASQTSEAAPEVVCPAPRDQWRAVLAADPAALLSHTPEWLEMICAAEGWSDASRLYLWSSGRSLVLPLVSKAVGGWCRVVESLPPGWGFGGLVGADITPAAVSAVYQDLRGQRALRLRVCPNPLQGRAWTAGLGHCDATAAAVPRRAHVLDLEGGTAAIWKRFSTNVQRGIRKAEKQRLDIECDMSGGSLHVFEDLWRQSTRRWASQQHLPTWLIRSRGYRLNPPERWQRIAESAAGGVVTWIARYEGEPAAAIIVLRGSSHHYTRGAMNKALAGPTRANFLLHWLAIRDACERNARWYQMGQSGGGGDSVSRFKEGFGAQAYEFPEITLQQLPITRFKQWLWSAAKTLNRMRLRSGV